MKTKVSTFQSYNPVNYALTDAQRHAGIYIPTNSNGDMKFAFVVMVGKNPVRSFDFFITDEQMQSTKIGISLAAKMAYKTAWVLVYAWGSDDRWHKVDKCDDPNNGAWYPLSSGFRLVNRLGKSFYEADLPMKEQMAQYYKDMGIKA